MRVEHPRRPHQPDSILLMVASIAAFFAALFSVPRALAETPPASVPHTTTLVVFAAHPIPEGEWTALLDSLRKDVLLEAEQTPQLRGPFEVLRADTMPPGRVVEIPISVYLHGDCRLAPHPFTIAQGTLGWVLRVDGHIEPFIHIDCARLVNMLSPVSLAMTQNRRNEVMGEAITRVILHEWIHIATQSSQHAKRGVEKSHFGVMDLLADEEKTHRRRPIHERKRKKS